ncbi:MAG: bifunctional nuclease family protein [Proteobacteria bacterium]|nr:bifunctional nuclease family protein [Pseudomonadota bacterium]
MKFFEMKVAAVLIDPEKASPLVILKDSEEKNVLPLCIGGMEAASMLMGAENIRPEISTPWELMTKVISSLGGEVKKVSIVDVKDGTYYSELSLHTKDGEVTVDARPADAIALALRCEAPILVSESVVKSSRIVDFTSESIGTLSADELTGILENFSTEDFGKYKM